MNEMNQRTERAPTCLRAGTPPRATPEALAAAQAKAAENWNSYLRAVAELENYRKRAEREIDKRASTRSSASPRNWCPWAMPWRRASSCGRQSDGAARGRTGDPEGAQPRLRQGRYQGHRPEGSALRPELARGHGGPGKPRCSPEYRDVGDPEGLLPERPAAAAGAGDRQQGSRGYAIEIDQIPPGSGSFFELF